MNSSAAHSTEGGQAGEESLAFAEARCLSKTWRVFMDGYWGLDHGLWEVCLLLLLCLMRLSVTGYPHCTVPIHLYWLFGFNIDEMETGNHADNQESITNLTNPLITEINFPSEIIYTLSTLAPSSIALSLIHRFLLTRLPDENTPAADLDLYTLSLASSQSVPAAFSFIRSLPTESQGRLRDGIWSWAFGAPKSPCGLYSKGQTKVDQRAIKEILHLPLLAHEDDQLLQFLLSPPRSISSESLSLLHDLVTLRLIHQGKYAESLQLDKELAGTGGSEINRQKRREMVREFIAILPEAQRRALAVDGEFVASRIQKERVNGEGYMEIDNQPKTVSVPTPAKQIPSFPLETVPAQTSTSTPTPTGIPKASPAPQSRVTSISSPFSGPPRFAPSNTSTHSPQISRVLSGSPFTLPMSRGANAVRSASSSGMRTPTMGNRELPIPRPKVRPVEVDEEIFQNGNGKGKGRKRVRDDEDGGGGVDVDMEQQQETAESINDSHEADEQKQIATPEPQAEPAKEAEVEIEVEPRHAETTTQDESPAQPTPEKQSSPTPAPTPRARRTKPPAPSPTPRKSTRQSNPPPSPLHTRIPGSFDLSIPQSVPEDQPLQPQKQTQTRQSNTKSKPKPKPKEAEPPAPRSRMTRSVSRAISLDLDASSPPPPPQTQSVKRARSRRGSTATPSEVPERGSPTPSTRSRRAGSQTPRKSTRTRK